ncbi:Cupredoxin [Laetiporus sulphureus 93-53]|uniref:Cupredoxin n=1 Tax=Laetiporus sulphureus 93-53 TaxID=1314785 RepID=A0A165C260_9APHY|nr:Cupredoxin [Laetiporus sulphureus 93-53]KZT02063.1 Cupredoxin [Laetiporus sulphureus 93-53]
MFFSAILAAVLPIAALGAEITIQVGPNNTNTYSPTNVTAAAGDVLTFEFVSGNHTVTQSSFKTPCDELTFANGSTGLDSGFLPANSSTTTMPTYKVLVNDTTPLWFYCRHPGHCQQGMVFAVNPTSNETFAEFQAAAKASNETSTSTSTTQSSGSTTATSSSASATSTTSKSNAGATRLGSAGAMLSAIGVVAAWVL